MNANRIRILALRVINQMVADRRTLAMMIVVPVFLLGMLAILIRESEPDMQIAVVNQDEGATLLDNEVVLGERLQTALDEFGEFEVEALDAREAEDRLAEGEVEAVIYVPADFTSQAMAEQTLRMRVQYEGSNPMLAENLGDIIERAALQTVNTLAAAGTSPLASTGGGGPRPMEVRTDIQEAYLHGGEEYGTLDYMAPALLGFFVFFFVFLLTCISFLRERVAGTLERLLATPIRSAEIIVGYMAGFLVFGLLQGIITLFFVVVVLDINYAGTLLAVFVVEFLLVMVSVNVGIFLSTFAQNEFQVMQFIPLVIVPQGLLGGVVWEIETMPAWLQPIAQVMPLTFANDALRGVMIAGNSLGDEAGNLLVLLGYAVAAVLLSAWTASRARI
jgi:ABC-2 type transport system permease protein